MYRLSNPCHATAKSHDIVIGYRSSESSAFYFDEQIVSNQIDSYSKYKNCYLIEEMVFQVLAQS